MSSFINSCEAKSFKFCRQHMQKLLRKILLGCIIPTILSSACSGHEGIVHQYITAKAVDESFKFEIFMRDVLGVDSTSSIDQPKFPLTAFYGLSSSPRTARQWIIEGSFREDDEEGFFTQRVYAHFYDPVNKSGLSDRFFASDSVLAHFVGPFPNSFNWAINATSASLPGIGKNLWNWKFARDSEYYALTSSPKEERDIYFAQMFRGLGQVVHLLQDTSQPEHVRNTQHVANNRYFTSPFRSFLEEYGSQYYEEILDDTKSNYANVIPSIVHVNRLRDFWDRNALSNGTSPANSQINSLGLAEFTNENYLGIRSLYGEFYSNNDIHYYQYPSLLDTNAQSVLRAYGDTGVDQVVGEDGVTRSPVYISKVTNGIKVIHHSRVTYLGMRLASLLDGDVHFYSGYGIGVTIHDQKVEDDYLRVLLPMAKQYSQSLLDYFFRGRISATIFWDIANQKLSVDIYNASTEVLSDGKFEMFWDDEDGKRQRMDNFSTDKQRLNPFEHAIGTFTVPPGPIHARQCTIVYKGNIIYAEDTFNDPNDPAFGSHWESGPIDPDDQDIAVTACHTRLSCGMQFAQRNSSVNVLFAGIQNNTPPGNEGEIVDVSSINGIQKFTLTRLSAVTQLSNHYGRVYDGEGGIEAIYDLSSYITWSHYRPPAPPPAPSRMYGDIQVICSNADTLIYTVQASISNPWIFGYYGPGLSMVNEYTSLNQFGIFGTGTIFVNDH